MVVTATKHPSTRPYGKRLWLGEELDRSLIVRRVPLCGVSAAIPRLHPADARLVRTALEENNVAGEVSIFMDGEEAIYSIGVVDADTAECLDLVSSTSICRKSPAA